MTKKSFRAQKVPRPDYPRLGELDAGALRTWGLAAVGGLLLGGGGCARSPAAPPPANPTTQAATGTATGTGTESDTGAVPWHDSPTDGIPVYERVQREQGRAAIDLAMNVADKGKAKPPRTPPPDRRRTPGKIVMPKVEAPANGK